MTTRRRQTPAQRYDTTLKRVFQALPSRFVELILGAPPLEAVTIELPSVKQRRADLAYRTPDGELHQFELQSDNDEEMDPRMLEYYAHFWRQNKRPPMQHVLYVGAAPLRMTGNVEHRHLSYRYEVHDIRTFDPAQLLASEFINDNLLAVLCRQGTAPEVVQEILHRLVSLPKQQRMDHLEELLILSSLRKATGIIVEEAEKMSLEINFMEDPFLQSLVLQSEQRGEQHGIKIGAHRERQRVLREQLEYRFGKLPQWALKQLAAADTATLRQWSLQLLKAKKLADVLPKPPAKR